jgi:hypothetical protein
MVIKPWIWIRIRIDKTMLDLGLIRIRIETIADPQHWIPYSQPVRYMHCQR